MIGVRQLSQLFRHISERVHAKRDELCELDGYIGDGDHGISMDLGWAAVRDVPIDGITDCGEYLKACAKAFIQAVGASIGPLYGTAFLRAAVYASGKQNLSVSDCIEMFTAGVEGIRERGKAKVGDKTLLDTLLPCTEVLQGAKDISQSLHNVMQRAVEAAKSGMESTRDMVANIGRSSRLGERSRGTVDPGAASAYVVVQAINEFVLQHMNKGVVSVSGLHRLNELGQSVWYDNIERGLIQSGELEELVNNGVTGVTSNPTIFEKAVTQSSVYDESLADGWRQGKTAEQLYNELVVEDIQKAADLLLDVYDKSNGQDGYVSVEVSPELAYNETATVEDALRLWTLVNRPNVMVKVPATDEGIDAVRTLIRNGVNVNVTLIFGIRQYERVMEAYLEGLTERHKNGESISNIASVASFFVSRVDDTVDKLIKEKGVDERYLGKSAIANAKVAYEAFRKVFTSDRFAPLQEQGAHVQRILWASTGPKNPVYPQLLYVRNLIGKDSVNTMPPHILNLAKEQNYYEESIEEGLVEARETLQSLKAFGIDTEQIAEDLLNAGVKAFEASYHNLLKQIEIKAQRVFTA
jgi:transaldolase